MKLDGACNFRDLGGYPARDGRLTRRGRLFRSDALNELSHGDVTALRSVGLATVIDLRTQAEVERNGKGPLDGRVRYAGFSVLPEEGGESVAAPAPVGDDLAERYLWYLDVGREAIAGVLRLLAEPSAYPAVIHCTAGKDRTGVVAALVLDCLGVSAEVIARDYAETTGRLDAILRRLQRDPLYRAAGRRVADGHMADGHVIPARLRAEAATMRRFLEFLYREFGGAGPWALSAGVSTGELGRLATLLLEEDAPAAARTARESPQAAEPDGGMAVAGGPAG